MDPTFGGANADPGVAGFVNALKINEVNTDPGWGSRQPCSVLETMIVLAEVLFRVNVGLDEGILPVCFPSHTQRRSLLTFLNYIEGLQRAKIKYASIRLSCTL